MVEYGQILQISPGFEARALNLFCLPFGFQVSEFQLWDLFTRLCQVSEFQLWDLFTL